MYINLTMWLLTAAGAFALAVGEFTRSDYHAASIRQDGGWRRVAFIVSLVILGLMCVARAATSYYFGR